MAVFTQVAVASDDDGSNTVFALDEAGRVYYTFWKDNKWQNWILLPLHPSKQRVRDDGKN